MSNNESRLIILSENIGEGSVSNVVQKIIEWNMTDDNMESKQKSYTRQPIVLLVNSYGGSVYDGYGIISIIKTSVTPIYTICTGKAMSMGLAIFLSGHVRIAHEYATFVYHEISTGMWGNLTFIKNQTGEMERLQKMYDEIMLEKSNITQEKLNEIKNVRKDWFISGNEALKYGMVDTLLTKDQQITWSFPQE